jgi:hypothetical protein
MKWAGHATRMDELGTHTKYLNTGISEGKRPLGRLSRRWEDNMKIDLIKIKCEVADLINLTQFRSSGGRL